MNRLNRTCENQPSVVAGGTVETHPGCDIPDCRHETHHEPLPKSSEDFYACTGTDGCPPHTCGQGVTIMCICLLYTWVRTHPRPQARGGPMGNVLSCVGFSVPVNTAGLFFPIKVKDIHRMSKYTQRSLKALFYS